MVFNKTETESFQRGKNSFLNIFSSLLNQILGFIFAIYVKKLFLEYFSIELQGVTSLFNSVFSTIITADFGFSVMYIIGLYPCLSKNKQEETIELVSVFRRLFFMIEVFIFIAALCFAPFIEIVFNITYKNLTVVYFVYALNTITRIIEYKFKHITGIVDACQKNYVSYFFKCFLSLAEFILHIITIKYINNIYAYLLVALLILLVLSFYKTVWVYKTYPFVKGVKAAPLKKVIETGILKKAANYVYKVIYDLVYNSMDNVIISIVLNTTILAYASTYIGLFNSFIALITVVMFSIRSTTADFFYKNKDKKNLEGMVNTTCLINIFVSSIICVGMYSLTDEFIGLFYGTKYVIDRRIVVIILMSFIMDSIFRYIENIYYIGGLVFKEKKPLFFSAFTNLILSLLLIKPFGLAGVYLGTFFGKIVFWIGKTIYVSKYMLDKSSISLLSKQLKIYLFVFAQSELMYELLKNISFDNALIGLFIKGIISVLLTIVICFVIFYKKKEFKNLIIIAKELLLKR